MLDKWLSQLRALLAEIGLSNTAPAQHATGQDAQPVDESVSQTEQENGSQEVVPALQKIPEIDMRDVLIAKTRRAVDEAISLHLQALYGAGVLIDWVILGETVDPDLDNETDVHSLYVATSPEMTSWKLLGLTNAMAKYVYSGSL